MPPRSATTRRASLYLRIVIELIVPDYVVEGVVIYLVEGRSDRIIRGVAQAMIPLLQRVSFAARIDELLAVCSIVLHLTAEWTSSGCCAAAFRETCRIELENKPPVHRVTCSKKGNRRTRGDRARGTCWGRSSRGLPRCGRPALPCRDSHLPAPSEPDLPVPSFDLLV